MPRMRTAGRITRVALVTLFVVGGTASGSKGQDDLIIQALLELDDRCEVSADDPHVVDRLVLDIARDGGSGSNACADPLVAALLVRNAMSQDAHVREAEVRLTDLQRHILTFQDGPLPNPMRLMATGEAPGDARGVVELELIPEIYADSLSAFVNDQILATVHLYGEAEGGDEVESEGVQLSVEICDGCLTVCGSDITSAMGASEARSDGPGCTDASLGPLRSQCVDPDC